MEKILTVSVASYNLGEMIKTNIESFCNSNVADKVELIITDDGSKDDTPKIVEEYVKKYPNTIKLIKKMNEGPGSTVNSGIKHATGKYFRMVDGDDWVDTANLEKFIAFLEKTDVDMVVSDYQVYDNKQQLIIETVNYDLPIGGVFSFNEYYKTMPYEMHGVTFKTKILKDNKIVLDNCFYTDVEYLLFPIPFVSTATYFNYPVYVYRVAQAGQSVSVTSMKKNINQHDLVLTHLLNWYVENKTKLSSGQNHYIVKRIANMADVQLGTMLLFEINNENKNKVKMFIHKIKKCDAKIYALFKNGKKCKILIYSNYFLYPFVARKIQKIRGNA